MDLSKENKMAQSIFLHWYVPNRKNTFLIIGLLHVYIHYDVILFLKKVQLKICIFL